MHSSFVQFTLPNLRHLRAGLEVARAHSITRAARCVHLSQPAVTQAINKLERNLGVTLFERGFLGLIPTAAGGAFFTRVERAFDLLQKGAEQALRTSSPATRCGFSNFHALMTAQQLRALIAVSDHGNFSVAAREMGLAQPSVHRSARNLESLSGLALFRTTPIGIELTAVAQILLLAAKLACSEIRQGLDQIKEETGRGRTQFLLGALPMSRTAIVPAAVAEMVRSAPGSQIHVVDGRYEELLRSLREGDLDCLIGALREPVPADDVIQEPLFFDALAIVARKDHPLARKKRVSLEDTLAFPWVAPPKTTPAGAYLFKKLRIGEMKQTPVRVVSSSLVFLRGLLQSGDYLTIISRHQIRDEEMQGLLTALPVSLRDNNLSIGLTYRKNWKPTTIQARFLDQLRRAAFSSKAAAVPIEETYQAEAV
ncbi:MAG: LysR family transcriptional regulator [Xanthobacteraceae bacterium]|nr:LysR family transcriptional regulator [Xanthobacteraceae bacterium]